MRYIGIGIDILFLLDFAKNFCTSYIDSNEQMEVNTIRQISKNYLTQGPWIKDLIVSLPYSIIGNGIRYLQFFRLVRILKANEIYSQIRSKEKFKLVGDWL